MEVESLSCEPINWSVDELVKSPAFEAGSLKVRTLPLQFTSELPFALNNGMENKILETYRNFKTFKDFLNFLGLEHTPKNTRFVSKILKAHGIKHTFQSRFSSISAVSKENLQLIVDSSASIVDVLKKLNLRNCGGNAQTLKNRIDDLNIDTSTMINNKRQCVFRRNYYVDYSDYISKVTSRGKIKKYILDNGLIEYKCSECSCECIHNGKPLILQLDHIDGDNSNNRLDNLRFLCPNCHSQTETYCGRKNKKHKTSNCSKCGRVIKDTNKTGMCQACNVQEGTYSEIARNRHVKKGSNISITKEELENLITSNSLLAIGKMYNVSDNAVRKWCVKYYIDLTKLKFTKSRKYAVDVTKDFIPRT